MINFKHKGSFNNFESYLKKIRYINNKLYRILDKYGSQGVAALSSATPQDTGEAARSWSYEITKTDTGFSLGFYNDDMAGTVPLVVLLQYGHGTRGGTYVQGRDFINPALLPIINKLAEDLWKEVKYG